MVIHAHRSRVTYPRSVEWGGKDFFFTPQFVAQWCLEILIPPPRYFCSDTSVCVR